MHYTCSSLYIFYFYDSYMHIFLCIYTHKYHNFYLVYWSVRRTKKSINRLKENISLYLNYSFSINFSLLKGSIASYLFLQPFGIIIFSNELHPSKTPEPISMSWELKQIVFNELQSLKAWLPNNLNWCGSVIDDKEEHPQKASDSIYLRLSGKSKLIRLEQP